MVARPASVVSFHVVALVFMLAWAAVVIGQSEPGPAVERHRSVIAKVAAHARSAGEGGRGSRRGAPPIELPADLRAELPVVLRELAADLRVAPGAQRPAHSLLEALGSMREHARPAVPAIIASLGAWDTHNFHRIGYLCSGVEALALIAPESLQVVSALTKLLEGELPAGGSVCHRCGCLLDALAKSGPAAQSVAGPVLERLMTEPKFYTTYPDQLGKAVQAIGLGRASLATAMARVQRTDVAPRDRAETLGALAKGAPGLTKTDVTTLRDVATKLLNDEQFEVRAAAATTLSATGSEAVTPLIRALADWHYLVRVSAAQALGRLGPAAIAAAVPLAAAVDPYLGTALAAGEALVAIGPGAGVALDGRLASAPAHLRPVLAAVRRAVREQRVELVRDAIDRDVPKGPHNRGFALVTVKQVGSGTTPFDPVKHRIRFTFTVQRYEGPAKMPEATGDAITTSIATSMSTQALAGRRAGDRVDLLVSPDIAQSPIDGTSRHRDSWRTHVAGTPGYFDVTIERVCEPVIWTLFRGSGIIGPMRFELYCRD